MFHLCTPVLFGGMAQKLYKIPVSKKDICKHTKLMLNVWYVFHHQQSFLINEC